MSEAVARRAALAVVAYLDLQLVLPIADGHVGVAGARVLESVRQAFLNDAIGRKVDPSRKRDRLAVHVQLDGQTGAADFLQQRVEAVQAGLRGEFDVVTVATHGCQETAHLGKRSAAGPLDVL